MTETERTAEDRRARLMAEMDDGGTASVGGLSVKLQKFPPPDVSGMTPEEEKIAIERWIDAIVRWEREVVARQPAAVTTSPAPSADAPSAQAPVA